MPKAVFESRTVLEQIQESRRGQGKAYDERAEIRNMLSELGEDQIIRVSPEGEESDRKLKRMVTEAGKDIKKPVKYVVDGKDLLVFIPAPPDPNAPKRGRPKANPTA